MIAPESVFTIAPHAPFLETLVTRILDGTLAPDWPREGPFWLADMTIILPTRRARLALAEKFVARLGDRPMLLPDMRALGGEDPTEAPFFPPFDTAPPLPAIDPLKRRLILAALTERWMAAQEQAPFAAEGLAGYSSGPEAAEVFALADSLGTLIDDFLIARRPIAALAAVAPEELAAKWQQNLAFLSIALDAWPEILAREGEIDMAERTNLALDKQAQSAAALFGDRPVIVAGSTGSIPASAGLIAAVAGLPRGAIVLPGLDTGLSEGECAMLRDETRAPHGHPQYGLMKLLARLGMAPGAVTELAHPPVAPRTATVRASLALADATVDWQRRREAIGAAGLDAATRALAILAARTPEEEARAIALLVRDALEAGRSAAIVAPDQTLARRIQAELARFEIVMDDSAGTPLHQSRAGRLVRQIVTLVAGGCAGVDVMALLRDRHVTLGLSRKALGARADRLDFAALRGQRPQPGLAGLAAMVDANRDGVLAFPALRLDAAQAEAVHDLIARLGDALAPLADLFAAPGFSAAAFGSALDRTLALLRAPDADGHQPALEGEEILTPWLARLAAQEGQGPRLSARSLPFALAGLMAGEAVRPVRGARDDVAIYGRIEARLQTADLMVLSGLNEGIWPEVADPGPWLSRGMRLAAGLEPPERLHGLAALDFALGLGVEHCVLSYAERQGNGPANPSRLVQRLEAFVGEERARAMRARGDRWRAAARRLDAVPGPPQPARRPEPRPPDRLRPRRLSITEAETLLRSPYALYARHVLRLRPVPPLGGDPDAAERGSIIHEILGRFVTSGCDPLAPEAAARLAELAAEAFAGLEAIPERREIWMRRFAGVAERFLVFERARAPGIAARHAEIDGEWAFAVEDASFTLTGRADRIDLSRDGRYHIIDFKTGGIPEPADMRGFLAPQLPLEAAMARHGAFRGLAGAPPDHLTYIKISHGPEAFVEKPFALPEGMTLDAAVDAVFRRFQGHVAALLLSDALPMTASVLPNPKQRFAGPYDHLARMAEWAATAEGDEP